jgi:hypothetical protein
MLEAYASHKQCKFDLFCFCCSQNFGVMLSSCLMNPLTPKSCAGAWKPTAFIASVMVQNRDELPFAPQH